MIKFKTKNFFILLFGLFCVFNKIIASIIVCDDNKHKLILSKPAKRIVTLSDEANDYLLILKATDKIIATSSYEKNNLPKKIINIGMYPNIDFEKLLFMHPDLIILSNFGLTTKIIASLDKFKIPYYLINPKQIESISKNIKKIGYIIGNDNADNISKQFQDKIYYLNKKNASKHLKTVFYQLWDFPLMTIGQETIINQVINLCGGKNIFNNINMPYPVVSINNVLMKNPDIIITNVEDNFSYWQQFSKLKAVINKNIYYIDPDITQRNSPLLLNGIETICRNINASF